MVHEAKSGAKTEDRTPPQARAAHRGTAKRQDAPPSVAFGATWAGTGFKRSHIDQALAAAFPNEWPKRGVRYEATSEDANHCTSMFLFHASLLDMQTKTGTAGNRKWLKLVANHAGRLCRLLQRDPAAAAVVAPEQKQIFVKLMDTMAASPVDPSSILMDRGNWYARKLLEGDGQKSGQIEGDNAQVRRATERAILGVHWLYSQATAVLSACEMGKRKRGRPQTVADRYLISKLAHFFERVTKTKARFTMPKEHLGTAPDGPFIRFLRSLVGAFPDPKLRKSNSETTVAPVSNKEAFGIGHPEIEGYPRGKWLERIHALARSKAAVRDVLELLKTAER